MPDHVPGCSCGGAPLDAVDLDIRSALPDAILALPAEQQASAWGHSDVQWLEGVGGFLRCLMPVRLTGGASVRYSVWLKLDDQQMRHAGAVWTTPDYTDLTLRGEVANAIEPWPGLLGEIAGAEVRDADTLPYLVAEPGTLLSRVLTEVWDRDDVLSRIWHPLPLPVRQQFSATWSVERTTGLRPSRADDGAMMFAGPGRTVRLEAFGTPQAATADSAIADISAGLPERCDGEVSERDGDLVRRAFRLTEIVDGAPQYELHGFVATSAGILRITCTYDDIADLTWAQEVWRSARHHAVERDASDSPV